MFFTQVIDDRRPIDMDPNLVIDKVQHSRIVEGMYIESKANWLGDARQRVVVQGCISDCSSVISVSQASLLGRLLFEIL